MRAVIISALALALTCSLSFRAEAQQPPQTADAATGSEPAATDPAEQAADTPAAAQTPESEVRRCRTVRETGSRMRTQRICETEQSQRLRNDLNDARTASTAMQAPPPGAR